MHSGMQRVPYYSKFLLAWHSDLGKARTVAAALAARHVEQPYFCVQIAAGR